MGNVYIQKRGKVYQYQFAIASVDGKRKYKNKFGFRTKSEAIELGVKAYDEFINGVTNIECNMLYGEYLDYWIKDILNKFKYSTAKIYKEYTKKIFLQNIQKISNKTMEYIFARIEDFPNIEKRIENAMHY